MTKKVILILLALALAAGLFITAGCTNKEKAIAGFNQEYDALQADLQVKRKAIKSREAYDAFIKEMNGRLNDLLTKIDAAGEGDGLDLLRGKLLMDMNKDAEALVKFDALIQKNSPLMGDAKFQKVRALLSTQKVAEAESLFKEIDASLQKNKDYYNVIMAFAYMTPNVAEQSKYARIFLDGAEDTEEFKESKASMYELLADVEKSKGNIAEAKRLLEEALTKVKGANAETEINMALKRIDMIGQPAPAIMAENWLNGPSLDLAKLKGKVVLIDFWAPWCPPCRAVIPSLVKMYNEMKAQGLVVIGFTKLYGSYRDELEDKGKQAPEEERKFIQGFVTRIQITYPIAIADAASTFEAYAVRGIPTLVVIDKAGKVREIKVGSGDEASLEIKIRELLLEK